MLYLVDTENISLRKLLENISPKRGDKVIFFYSENCPQMPIELVKSLKIDGVKMLCKDTIVGKPNALDFQLVSYLGYILRFSFKRKEVAIVSNDKAFECVAQFWNVQGYNVKTIQPPKEHAEENRAKQKILSAQKQKLNSQLFTTIRNNKERWGVINCVFKQGNSRTDINIYLTQRFDGKQLRNINNIIKPYIVNKVG